MSVRFASRCGTKGVVGKFFHRPWDLNATEFSRFKTGRSALKANLGAAENVGVQGGLHDFAGSLLRWGSLVRGTVMLKWRAHGSLSAQQFRQWGGPYGFFLCTPSSDPRLKKA